MFDDFRKGREEDLVLSIRRILIQIDSYSTLQKLIFSKQGISVSLDFCVHASLTKLVNMVNIIYICLALLLLRT